MNFPPQKTKDCPYRTAFYLRARISSPDGSRRRPTWTRKPATLTADNRPSRKIAGMAIPCNNRFSITPKRAPPRFLFWTLSISYERKSGFILLPAPGRHPPTALGVSGREQTRNPDTKTLSDPALSPVSYLMPPGSALHPSDNLHRPPLHY